MKVCLFGDYDQNYSRNKVFIKSLILNDVEIFECHTVLMNWRKYWELYKKHKEIKNQYDVLIVMYSLSRWLVLFAKIISNKPIAWDPFFSIYDNWVNDRKYLKPYNPKSFYYLFKDWLSCILADKIILDTYEHIKYFNKVFNIRQSKFFRVLVGTDDTVMYPREVNKKSNEFVVEFHGNYIPLQGVDVIVKSAKLLEAEGIIFNLIGKGQEYKKIRNLAKELGVDNINFIDPVSYQELPNYMVSADVCIGLVGDVPRVARVIPNKVYEAAAMKKAIISADTPAINELFSDGENILLCQQGNAEELAIKIKMLRNNENLREKIAQNAYVMVKRKAFSSQIGIGLKQELINLINN